MSEIETTPTPTPTTPLGVDGGEETSKIYIHEDHEFEKYPDTVYYTKFLLAKSREPFELGIFKYNQRAWNAGNWGSGDGECKFSNFTFSRECPYSAVFYYGKKTTPGTTVGPEYQFGEHPDRIYYRTDKSGNPIKLGKALEYCAKYDAGFNGSSNGYSIFEFDKITFRGYDCRIILPTKNKVYFL